jgi:hypothetical protein
MKENDYIQQITDIRKIIAERTKFNALSGLSGVLAGSYALIGAYIAYKIIYSSEIILYKEFSGRYFHPDILKLFIVAGIVLGASILTGLYFSYRKARAKGEILFNNVAIKIIKNFSLFLLTGFIILVAVYIKGALTLLAPLCLVFYGLALVHVSSFITSEIYGLGRLIIVIGLLSLFYPGYGLIFWAMGFGLMHIIYGILMWYRYERVK